MTISIDPHSGFCFGVTRAIGQAEKELATAPLFCLGDIVHNGQEVERLEQKGLQTIDYETLRELRQGRVLFRAHGEPPSTYNIARNNELEIIDATCPVVKRLQERIRDTYNNHPDAQTVIFGKAGHAEVIGLIGQTNNTAIVIESPDDLDRIDYRRPIYLFSQTTKSVGQFQQIVEEITRRRNLLFGLPSAGLQQPANSQTQTSEHADTSSLPPFEWHNTICRSVSNRVEEIKAFAREQDLVYFVGGEKSSNAKVLYAHCKEANPNTVFLSSPEEITSLPDKSSLAATRKITDKQDTRKDYRIGICGATSTPRWLMLAVRDRLADKISAW